MHFLTFSRLNRHIKEVHEVKEFKCKEPKCVDSFNTQKLLDDHTVKRHTRVACPICQKMIADKLLTLHIQNMHEASNNVCCELCGKVSLNKQTHKAHYQTAHTTVERLQCDICGQ